MKSLVNFYKDFIAVSPTLFGLLGGAYILFESFKNWSWWSVLFIGWVILVANQWVKIMEVENESCK